MTAFLRDELMAEDLICPDCGGIIGGEPGTGRKVCECFVTRKTVSVEPRPMMPEATEMPIDDPSGTGEKICRVCGKNLKGHRRFKDSRGYTCAQCHESDLHAGPNANLIPCTECGRKLKIDGITTYDGRVMCKRCASEKRELNKFKPPVAALVMKEKEAEKATLRNLLIVAGVLLLIMLLAGFGLIGR